MTDKKYKYDALFCGYYGMGNKGDEASLAYTAREIHRRRQNVRLAYLSGKAGYVQSGIFPINRYNPIAVIKAMRQSRVFVFGGGSLMQNATSRRSLIYYSLLISLAEIFCNKITVYANGIGPLYGKHAKKLCARILRAAESISVRDGESYRLAKSLGVPEEKLSLVSDPVFLAGSYLDITKPKSLSRKYIAVSLRPVQKQKIDVRKIAKVLRTFPDRTPVFISMQDSTDLEISRKAASLTGGLVLRAMDISELIAFLRFADAAVGMRLHFLIAAVIAGVPSVALSYDLKIDGVIGGIGCVPVLSAFDFTEKELRSSLSSVIDNSNRIKREMSLASRFLGNLSEDGAEMLCRDIFREKTPFPLEEKEKGLSAAE